MSSIPRMPWGKHKGVPLDEIDAGYLNWIVEKATATSSGLRDDVLAELARRRRAEAPPPPSSWRKPCPDPVLAGEIVTTGWRALAKKHHPDIGGDTGTMQRLNATADWLKTQVPQ
jgi:hypothetical protein